MGFFNHKKVVKAGKVQTMTISLDMRRKSDIKQYTNALADGWTVQSAVPTLSAYTEFVFTRTR